MKKLVAISILLTLLTAAAFAQFKVGLQATFEPNLLLVTTPTGDNANTTGKTGARAQSVFGLGDYVYGGTGTFDLLSTEGVWTSGYWHGLDVDLTYSDPNGNFGGLLQLDAGQWVRVLAAGSYDADEDGWADTDSDPGFFGNALPSVLGFLNVPFGDWNLWGKVGIFKAFVGNTANRGATSAGRYDGNFNSFFDSAQIDNFGILVPTDGTSGFELNAMDINNLGKHIARGALGTSGNAYVSLSAALAPVTVDVAGDFGTDLVGAVRTRSHSSAGFALRVSGAKIADLVNFDVIYKLHGADTDTDDKVSAPGTTTNNQPGGEGVWENAFGLYANFDLDSIVAGLGVSVGYSGFVQAQEDQKVGADTFKHINPYYNGIDLRAKFSAGPLLLTFNNNFSFSAISGDDDRLTRVGGLTGETDIARLNTTRAKEITQSYFAMYNALGVTYAIDDALSANVSIGNTLFTFNETENFVESRKNVRDEARDIFTATAAATYSFNDNVALEAGLAFKVEGSSIKYTDMTSQEFGKFTFGIPIRFQVKW